MTTTNEALSTWVDEVAALTKPDRIHWCDGSEEEYQALVQLMLDNGSLLELNQDTHPNCYLHRSDPNDVARVEHLTFVCSKEEADAGPNNHWMAPAEGHKKIDALFEGCMEGRTMYVIPYCMGPIDSPISRCGVEISDSPYVAANMKIMTRMGAAALERIERKGREGVAFVKGLHSTGDLSPDRRFIMHFPEEKQIKSIGSGYGGNALLGKKCHALRIASWQAQEEGWLAEHMLIVGIENPQGETRYVAAAFPSACGKTNLAMLIPPQAYKEAGWKIWTVGDDIAWLSRGDDGRLYAINPEAGYFGVVPGTSRKTNKNAFDSIQHDTIFTNVGVTADNQPWWEGGGFDTVPVTDWKGNPYDPEKGPAAHPNSRFTVAAKQNPCYSDVAEAARGVPIDAIVFGGRRRELAPLVMQAKDWEHGVLMGAAVASETTAAATGAVGVVRRDPMAMKPFCGTNFADYWQHWLSFGQDADKLPKVFHVNWFRQDKDNNFLWPGFSDNLRVLQWILNRCDGEGDVVDTAVGYLPTADGLDTDGLDIDPAVLAELLSIDEAAWANEVDSIEEYLTSYGDRLPQELMNQLNKIRQQLNA